MLRLFQDIQIGGGMAGFFRCEEPSRAITKKAGFMLPVSKIL